MRFSSHRPLAGSGADEDIRQKLWNALKDYDEVILGPGTCKLSRTIPVMSGKTIKGTLGSGTNPPKLTRILATTDFEDTATNVDDAMFVIGTASTAGPGLPFRGAGSLYGTRKLRLAPFAGDATVLSLADATAGADFKTALLANDKDYAYVMTSAFWRKEYDDFRPLRGTVVKIVSFYPGPNQITLAKPIGFGSPTTTIDDGVIAIYSKVDYPGQKKVWTPLLTTPQLVPWFLAHDVTVKDLILDNGGNSRPPLIIWGDYDITIDNLELHGAGIIGGNAITRSTITNLTGSCKRRVIDFGFVSSHNELTGWRVQKIGRISDSPMFQCSESSSDNHFDDITVLGVLSTFTEGFRLQSVRDFSIENTTIKGVFMNGPVREDNHEKEHFLVLYPSGDPGLFDALSGIGIETSPGQSVEQPVSKKQVTNIGDAGNPAVLLLSWKAVRAVPAFLAAALPGRRVFDKDNRSARAAFAVKATFTTGITHFLDKFYMAQLELWNHGAPAPQLKLVGSTTVFPVIDLISMGSNWIIFGYRLDTAQPDLGPSTDFVCENIPFLAGITFHPLSAVIDDDNDKNAVNNEYVAPIDNGDGTFTFDNLP